MNRIIAPLRSQTVTDSDPSVAIEAIVGDLVEIARAVGTRTLIYLSGADRIVCPVAGVAKVYAVSAMTTTGSDGSNYFTVQALRNGQAEATLTRNSYTGGEIAGYSEFYLGVIQVGKGDVIAIQVVATGGPIYPFLTTGALCMRIELGPQATVR